MAVCPRCKKVPLPALRNKIAEILIEYDGDGVRVTGPLADPDLCVLMLEGAARQIKEHARLTKNVILVPEHPDYWINARK